MPKVVSGKDFDKFVETGEHQTLDGASKKTPAKVIEPPKEVRELVTKAEAATAADMKPEAEPEDTGLEAEDNDLAERAQKRISKKHKEMKQAVALADRLKSELEDTENFSKSQYQRAQLAEERAQALERELNELRAKAPKAESAGKEGGKPDPKDFYDEKGQFKAFEYAEKLAEYSATQAVEKDRAEQLKAQRDVENAKAEALAKERVEQSKKLHPDWQKVVEAAGVNVPAMVAQYMTVSEHIGEIAYYLAKNPAFAERINSLNPIKAIAEIGKLEAQWDKGTEATTEEKPAIPKAPSVGAPAPISPLSGQGSPGVNSDPAKMTPKELLAYTREREVARKRR